jgi:hypothetical protein
LRSVYEPIRIDDREMFYEGSAILYPKLAR